MCPEVQICLLFSGGNFAVNFAIFRSIHSSPSLDHLDLWFGSFCLSEAFVPVKRPRTEQGRISREESPQPEKVGCHSSPMKVFVEYIQRRLFSLPKLILQAILYQVEDSTIQRCGVLGQLPYHV
jgi:hypothetical protein